MNPHSGHNSLREKWEFAVREETILKVQKCPMGDHIV